MVPTEVGKQHVRIGGWCHTCGGTGVPEIEHVDSTWSARSEQVPATYDEALKEIRRLRAIIRRAGNELDEAYQ